MRGCDGAEGRLVAKVPSAPSPSVVGIKCQGKSYRGHGMAREKCKVDILLDRKLCSFDSRCRLPTWRIYITLKVASYPTHIVGLDPTPVCEHPSVHRAPPDVPPKTVNIAMRESAQPA